MGRKVNQDHKIRSLVLNRVVKWMFFLLNKVRVWRPRGTHLYPNFPLVPLMHASLYMYLREFSIRAGGRRFTWTRRLLFFGNYPSLNRVLVCCHWIIKPKLILMMSVFCSNTLIFAPECWKCILDAFKFFQQLALTSHAFAVSLFPSSPTPMLLPST